MSAKETPTEFLIRSLENIENAEDVILVVRQKLDGGDDITFYANDIPIWQVMGMLEMAKAAAYHTAGEIEKDEEEGV